MDVNLLDIRWMDKGACLDAADLPWTTDTWKIPEFARASAVARMADVCASCPVLDRCAPLASGMTGGFWAGRDRALHPKTVRLGRRVEFVQPSLGLELGGVA